MAKMTKETMVENMKGYLANATDKVKELINYTVEAYNKNPRNVTLDDLKMTLKDIFEMQPSLVVSPIENSIKKVGDKKDTKEDKPSTGGKVTKLAPKGGKGKATITEKEAEDKLKDILNEGDTDTETGSADKETAITSTGEEKGIVNKNKNKGKSKDKEETAIKTLEFVANFPETLDSTVGKLKIRKDIKSIKELHDLVEEGSQIVACVYWNKRHLKQFNYDSIGIQPKPIKEFPNDLDIVDLMYVSENGLVIYGVSLYSEVAMTFTPANFESDEEGIRYENGAEYQLYEIVE